MPRIPLRFTDLSGIIDSQANNNSQITFFSGSHSNSSKHVSHQQITIHGSCELYKRNGIAPQPGWSLPLEPMIKSAYLLKTKNLLILPHGIQRKKDNTDSATSIVRVNELASKTQIGIPKLQCNTDLLIAESGLIFNDSLSRYRYLSNSVDVDPDGNKGFVEYAANEGLDVIDEPSIFIGSVSKHFGHLLVETSSRLWAYNSFYSNELDQRKPIGFASHGLSSNKFNDFPKLVSSFLGHLLPQKAANNIGIIRKATLCRDVIIPKAMSPFFHSSSLQFAETMQRYSRHALIACKDELDYIPKVYISRSKAGETGRQGLNHTHELHLEKHLIKLGYHIMHPELISLERSAAIMQNAKKVISTWGSQFHRISFCSAGTDVLRICPSSFRGETDTLISLSVNINLYDLVVNVNNQAGVDSRERVAWAFKPGEEKDVCILLDAFDSI